MKKKYITLMSAIVIGASAPMVGLADNVDSAINQADSKIENLKEQKKDSQAKLAELEKRIADLDAQVTKTLNEKVTLEKELYQLNIDISNLEESIEKRTDQISEQARATQVNQANHSYLDMVLDSENISDAITRSIAYGKLVKANNDIANAQKDDKDNLEKIQEEVDKKIAKVTKITAVLKEQQDEMNTKKYDQAILAKQVEADLTKEESKKESLLKEKAAAEKRKADAEAAAIAESRQRELDTAAARSNAPVIDTSVGGGGGAPGNGAKPPVRNGDFQWPIPSIRITSGYGGRQDPTGTAGTYHDGIDMAGNLNDHIHASRAGVVVTTGNHPSAGNHVIIKHDNGYYTYYLHLNTIGTSVGANVNAGDVIGYMGTTGNSTGVHLHFGVSTGIWNGFLDPGPFLGLY